MAKLINNRFYFDYNATSPVEEAVIQNLQSGDLPFANPSSLHQSGKIAKRKINETIDYLLSLFNLKNSHQVLFHSGATEFINSIFKVSAFNGLREKCKHVYLVSPLDHMAIIQMQEYVVQCGHEFIFMKVNSDGEIDLIDLEEKLKTFNGKPIFLNWTWVNNETGVISSLKDICHLKDRFNFYLHVDAVQSVFKIDNWKTIDERIDSLSYSAHKFGALKGVGFSFIKNNSSVFTFINGGSQQNNLRAGTENLHGILSIKWALEAGLQKENFPELQRSFHFISNEMKKILGEKGLIISEKAKNKNSNTLFILIPGSKAELVLASFDMHGMDISTGSACSSGIIKENRVLIALGFNSEDARSGVRLSFSPFMKMDDATKFVEKISSVLKKFV